MNKIQTKDLKVILKNIDEHKPILIIGCEGSRKVEIAEKIQILLNKKSIIRQELTDNLTRSFELDKLIIKNKDDIFIDSAMIEILVGKFDKVSDDKENSTWVDYVNLFKYELHILISKTNIIYVDDSKVYIQSKLLETNKDQTRREFREVETFSELYNKILVSCSSYYPGKVFILK